MNFRHDGENWTVTDIMWNDIDKDPWVMNYPYGSYNDQVINYIEGNGCKMAFVTKNRISIVGKDNRFEVSRLDCTDFPPISNNWKQY